jgi:phosphopantothenoylcysteine synthetase/decarboxylase
VTTAGDLAAMRPDFTAERLFLLVTGSINAALVPYWLHWLRQLYPDLVTHVAVTRSAERFVTREAVQQLVTGQVVLDSWDAVPAKLNHVAMNDMTDCFAVFPATTDSVMRLGAGRCDSPLLMTLQATDKPIGVAATFPATNPVIKDVLQRLALRHNVRFAPEVPAYSVGKNSWAGATGFFLPSLLETLEALLTPQAEP